MVLATRVVIVHRRSEYTELLERHSTYGQAEYFLRERGRSIDDVRERHDVLDRAIHEVSTRLPDDVRQARLERSELDRYLFGPEDIVMAIGQDGLVANVAKYLAGQPVIGVNPEPERNPGVLVAHRPLDAPGMVAKLRTGHARIESRAMVQATLDDGQSLEALNDLYIGDSGHQSARYTVTVPDRGSERHSSSGIIAGTGTGSTGWTASIVNDRSIDRGWLPPATSTGISWFTREAWPSMTTGTQLTGGILLDGQKLELLVESDRLVVFGDGIERDYLTAAWGQRLSVGLSARRLNLVVPA